MFEVGDCVIYNSEHYNHILNKNKIYTIINVSGKLVKIDESGFFPDYIFIKYPAYRKEKIMKIKSNIKYEKTI